MIIPKADPVITSHVLANELVGLFATLWKELNPVTVVFDEFVHPESLLFVLTSCQFDHMIILSEPEAIVNELLINSSCLTIV